MSRTPIVLLTALAAFVLGLSTVAAKPVDKDCRSLCRQAARACAKACDDGDCRRDCRDSKAVCLEAADLDADGDGIADACDAWDVLLSLVGNAGDLVNGAQAGVSFPAESLSIDAMSVDPVPPLAPVFLMSVNDLVPGQVRMAAVKDVGLTFALPADAFLLRFNVSGRHPVEEDFAVFGCFAADEFGTDVPVDCELTLLGLRLPGF